LDKEGKGKGKEKEKEKRKKEFIWLLTPKGWDDHVIGLLSSLLCP